MNNLGVIQNLGPMEIGIILGILLLFFGAKKLPELAKGIGQSFRELKKGVESVEEEDNE